MYSKIYDFCKVRNLGTVMANDPEIPTPRVQFLCELLKQEGIPYELDKSISRGKTTIYNIILKGNSNRMVVAHHDIVNAGIDNANDNSCSVINAIMIKKLMPHIHVVLLDGEELGGMGSQRVSEQINEGYFGEIEWVLNLELTVHSYPNSRRSFKVCASRPLNFFFVIKALPFSSIFLKT